ncbi:hypothetical protein AEGHOMDF_4081 [Methylobacterium soli]|nr:hypothetical protein AEGHOMDF_4081 [Methylobacterium soli]
MHDAPQATGGGDIGLVAARHVLALEQEHVGAAGEQPLDAHVEPVQHRARPVIVAAAMGRVGADHRAAADGGEAGIDAALGSVPVQDVGADGLGPAGDGPQDREVGEVRVAPHRQARHAEAEARRELGEGPLGALAPGRRIANDPDLMPGRGLEPREVDDVPEQPPDRRAEDVQDAVGRGGLGRIGDWGDHGSDSSRRSAGLEARSASVVEALRRRGGGRAGALNQPGGLGRA